MATMDASALSLSIMDQIQQLGSGSKVMVNKETFVKLKGVMSGAPFENPMKGMTIGDIEILISPNMPPGEVFFLDKNSVKSVLGPGPSISLMPKEHAGKTASAIEQQMTLMKEKTQKVGEDIADAFEKAFLKASMQTPKAPSSQGFLNEVNGSVPATDKGTLQAQLNSALKQNQALAAENVSLQIEITKLRNHHAACMPEPIKSDDIVATRFGNIAENL